MGHGGSNDCRAVQFSSVLLVSCFLLLVQSSAIVADNEHQKSNESHFQVDHHRDDLACLPSSNSDARKGSRRCTKVMLAAKFNRTHFDTYTDIRFNNSLDFRLVYSYDDAAAVNNHTFAIRTESPDATTDRPILIVVRHQNSVTSWQLPYIIGESQYISTKRTLCPSGKNSSTNDNRIVVDVTTSSASNVTFSIAVTVEKDFSVELDVNRNFTVDPSENRFYKFTFPPSVKQVMVRSFATSSDNICLTVAVQKSQCPVFDPINNVNGFRQSMSNQSYMIVQKEDYGSSFYLVYMVNPDNKTCASRNKTVTFVTSNNTHKNISLTIKTIISQEDFQSIVFVGTLGVYGGFVSLVIVTCFLVEYRRRKLKLAAKTWETNVKTYKSAELDTIPENESQKSESTIEKDQSIIHYCDRRDHRQNEITFHDCVSQSATAETYCDDSVSTAPSSTSTAQKERLKKIRNVSEMTTHNAEIYNKRSRRFMSELCIVAVFYLIPVGQLVWNYQYLMLTTGDQDICYYNFACAYPYRLGSIDFSDFNHFFSNIGYIVLGVVFLLITKRRDYVHSRMMLKPHHKEYGIPPHYGLFYSMGFGLVVEGILSACYHICPTRMNYQFDTSFMYVLAVLCTLKLYHARHADVNVKSYTAYFVLALIVLLGAWTPIHDSQYFKIAFMVCHLLVCIALSVDIYYMGHCEWKNNKEQIVEHVNNCWRSRPLYRERLVLVIIGTTANFAYAIYQFQNDTEVFNTHLLGLFMLNLFIYSMFYVVMKMFKHEWTFASHRLYPLLHLLVAFAFWLSGLHFFFNNATRWEESPAESRNLNSECLVAQVYDTHDLWHFLSSAALFFFFMFLLTLDDDVETKPRRDIPVF